MQHLIVLIIVLLIAGLTFTVTRWRGGLHMTFSQHAALSRQASVFYTLLFLVSMPLLLWFFASWLVPHNELPILFIWFAVAAAVFQIACTLIPETGGRKTIIHRILAGISGATMIPLVVIIALYSNSSSVVVAAWIALVCMFAITGFALSSLQKNYYLLLQAAYYTVFFVVILIATYI